MLLGDEARPDSGAEVLVKKLGDSIGTHVTTGLEETAGERGNRVGMGLDEAGEDFGEGAFVGRRGDLLFSPGEEGGEGVHVVVVDLGDVGVGDDDVGEVAEGFDAVGEADGEDGEGEVGGFVEG